MFLVSRVITPPPYLTGGGKGGGSEVLILFLGIVTRTGLSYTRQVTVTADSSFREQFVQATEELVQHYELFCSAIVFVGPPLVPPKGWRISPLLQFYQIVHISDGDLFGTISMSAFGADTDGVGIVASYMTAFELKRSAIVEGTVSTDIQVISGVIAEAA